MWIKCQSCGNETRISLRRGVRVSDARCHCGGSFKPLRSSGNITDRSLQLFLAYAGDANNWGGSPWLNGNLTLAKEDRGNLTQLKRAGLLETHRDPEQGEYVEFTQAGKDLAKAHGIEIEN